MSFEDSSTSKNPIIRRAEDQYRQNYTGPGFAAVNNQGNAQGNPGSGSPAQPPMPAQASSLAPSQAPQPAAQPHDAAQLQEMYNAPAVAGASGTAMTLNDVIMKSVMNFMILLAGAAFGWMTAVSMPYLWIGAALVGLGLGLANAFKKNVSPPLIMLYALVQGVFLGGISYFFQAFGEANGMGNLVQTAVVATFVVFAVMLTLYTKRIIKVNGKFKKIMAVALISYLVFAVISMFAAFMGVGTVDGVNFGFFGAGPLGIIFSVIVVCLAAFTLCLDFDAIEQGIKYGVPERESWRMSFGLMVTLIWLYLEILRLLALVAAGRD
jgi:uncharacterized YccA/Bax inhibitor family protein